MAQPNTCMLNRKVKNGLRTTIPYGVDTQADCGVTKESVWNRLVIVLKLFVLRPVHTERIMKGSS